MLWAACCLGFFGFLPSIHLAVSDVQADTLVNPTCFKIRTKSSKTDPFKIGHNIYVGRSNGTFYPMAAISNFLALKNIYLGIKQKKLAWISLLNDY